MKYAAWMLLGVLQVVGASPVTPLPVKHISPQQQDEYRCAAALAMPNQPASASARLDALRGCLARLPRHAAARLELAAMQLGQGNLVEAQAVLQQGLAVNPGDTSMVLVLARIQYAEGQAATALTTLQNYHLVGARLPETLAFEAALQLELGDAEAAVATYRLVLARVSVNGVWWLGLARALAQTGQLDASRQAYQQALQTGTLPPGLIAYARAELAKATPPH